MATRKRSKAAPKKKPRSARKGAPRSSSKREPKKRPKKVAKPTRAKKATKKSTVKKRPKKSAVASKTKKTVRHTQVAKAPKKSPPKQKKSATKKAPTKKSPPKQKKSATKKAPTKKSIRKPIAAPVKTAAPIKKPAKKPAKKITAKLSREGIELALEAHALAHAPLYKSHDAKAMGRDKYGVYTTDVVNLVLNEDTTPDVIKITIERGAEVADIIRARARGEGRIVLWASFLVARPVRGRNEGYSEESVTYNYALKQEVGIFWTGIRGSTPQRFPRKVREKVVDMSRRPTFLVAIFVYGRWARGKRRRRRR